MFKKYLYSFNDGLTIDHGFVFITDDGYVIDRFKNKIPLKDYGEYLLTTGPVDNAFELWLRKV